MDKIKKYQKAILTLLQSYERDISPLETILIRDTVQHHYQVLEVGWQNPDRYFYGVLFHIYLKADGKIWILENNTEDDLSEILLTQGVLQSDIVLSFIPERIRQHTGFAIA